jgi:hypothetical protein
MRVFQDGIGYALYEGVGADDVGSSRSESGGTMTGAVGRLRWRASKSWGSPISPA